MCKFCEVRPGPGWINQEKFINTGEEFKTRNNQRIWSRNSYKNTAYVVIYNFIGITPDYEGKENGRLHISIPELNEVVEISINYCPFCGEKIGDADTKYI